MLDIFLLASTLLFVMSPDCDEARIRPAHGVPRFLRHLSPLDVEGFE